MSAAPSPSRSRVPGTVEVLAGTQPPHSVEAERYLLASVLADDTWASYAAALNAGVRTPAAFHVVAHARIFQAIGALRARGDRLAVELVAMELQATGQLDSVGGMAGFAEATSAMPTSLRTREYAEQVAFLWARRHTLRLAAELREIGLGTSDRPRFVEAAAAVGQRLMGLGRREAALTLHEEIAAISADFDARVKGTVDKRGWIYTGLSEFDGRLLPLGSLSEDSLVVLAGGSSHGKSAAARQLVAGAVLDRGQRARVYSRESSTAGFVRGIIASRLAINLRYPESTPADKHAQFLAECARWQAELADRRLWCVQQSAATPLGTIEDLADDARTFAELRGAPDLWIVDYLQLFGTRRRLNKREEVVAHISHELQALARSLGGVWVVCAQLNESGLSEMRTVKRDENDRLIHRVPRASDLRESQAIFHDADRVIALYQPPEDCCGNDQTSLNVLRPEVWWCQIKGRSGGTGSARTWFEKQFTRFVPLGGDFERHARQADGHTPTDKAAFKGKTNPPASAEPTAGKPAKADDDGPF